MPGRVGFVGAGAALVVLLAVGVFAVATHSAPGHKPAAAPVTTTTSTSTTVIVAAGDPDVTGQVQPPTPGLYRYHQVSADAKVPATVWAEQISAQNGDLSITTSQGVSQTVSFSPTAERELAFSQTGDTVADEITCTELTPRLLLTLPLRAGAAWTSDADCTNLLGYTLAVHRVTKVTGPGMQPVGTAQVPVWELVTVETQVETPPGGGQRFTRSTTTTVDLSARYGLAVREVVQQGSDPASIVTDRLVSLQPA